MMAATYPLPSLAGETTFRKLICALLQTTRCWWQKRRDERAARAAFQAVRRLDDRLLDDLGLMRVDVEWAASLPLHLCAARALDERKRARQNR